MKNKIFSLLFTLVAVFALTGCDDWEPGQQKFAANTGGVNLGGLTVTVNDKTTPSSRAGVDTSNYLVSTADKAGNTVTYNGTECSWTFKDMPEVMTLPVVEGDNPYKVIVRSHAVQKAEWSHPYFEGEKEFSVNNGEITSIGTVTCKFAAIKVDVKFDDKILATVTDPKARVVANDEGELTWTATETRSGYYEAIDGSQTLVAEFTGTFNGQPVTRIKEFTDVEKGKYYIINFTLKTGPGIPDETGTIDPNGGITIDSTIEESDENGNVDAPTTPENPNDRPDKEEWPEEPTPPGPDEPGPDEPGQDEPIEITCATMPDFSKYYPITLPSYELVIGSKNPLSHLYVEIISDYLTEDFLQSVELSSKFDLAEPGDLDSALKDSFGFPTKEGVIGQTEVKFNLTPFIPLLELGKGEGVTKHTFKLRVVDNENNEKTVELKFDAEL